MVARDELEKYIKTLLFADEFQDYCPNGLQIEGRREIKKLLTGVTACQALIDEAIQQKADAILVHHGYFWKGEDSRITNIKKQRVQSLLDNDISLFAYHLPLDAHPEYGNNAQLVNLFGLEIEGPLEKHGRHDLGLVCRLPESSTAQILANELGMKLEREVQVLGPEQKEIKRLALCSGAAQTMFEDAIVNHGVDAYLSGELSEPTWHIANEYQVPYLALGHHASERYGVQALGYHLASEFGLDVIFKDIHNPV